MEVINSYTEVFHKGKVGIGMLMEDLGDIENGYTVLKMYSNSDQQLLMITFVLKRLYESVAKKYVRSYAGHWSK